jgi:hypothetical protein
MHRMHPAPVEKSLKVSKFSKKSYDKLRWDKSGTEQIAVYNSTLTGNEKCKHVWFCEEKVSDHSYLSFSFCYIASTQKLGSW